ncbi:DUF6484 domain-containing protein [Archangium violaceum]|uniref:DUF6484 domain-containing protein n=1 Tax=Archangium violaceum Cb vi76 TaxID=1406225 RepID=A0A084SWE8_9BACT|nr:DUF6484 domain-containing protein [Archangium violaceum]KFA92783.1 hypothetical protein Q664_13055 [Archangium violaceum Cb vi76]
MSTRPDTLKPEPHPESDAPEPIWGSVEGWIAGVDSAGRPLVDFEENTAEPIPARSAVALDAQTVRDAISIRRKVVLTFERGDPRRPFLLALLHEPSPTPLVDALLAAMTEPPAPPVEARTDGQPSTVELQGKHEVSLACGAARVTLTRDEVVLQCGEASIALQRNGKVVIRGATVETRARGTHRIKAGSVDIN